MEYGVNGRVVEGDMRRPATENNLPKSGVVNQVCREWLVHEDSALAYKLQEKEIEMHYGKNRQQRKLIRTDLQEAKNLQLVENTEATTHDNSAYSLQLQDEQVARKLQRELENEVSATMRSLELSDKEIAEELQRKESKQETSFNKRLFKPHKTKAATPRNCDPNDDASPTTAAAASFVDDAENREHVGRQTKGVQVALHSPCFYPENDDDLTVATSASVIDVADKERLRVVQEREDERLAMLLQEEETTKKSQTYRDQQLAIEVQDRELARLLQEQERARARKARHKYRKLKQSDDAKANEKHSHQSLTSEAVVHSDSSEACSSSSSSRVGDTEFSSRKPARPTNLSVSSSYMQETRVEPPTRHREAHSSSRWRGTPHSETFNVAMAIDPTYKRSHSSDHQAAASSVSPVLPTPVSIRSGSVEGVYPAAEDDEVYDQLDDDRAPPYMPIQGQKRTPVEKRKKKDGCKQQ